jgi:small-conductance mechanosensitive channel
MFIVTEGDADIANGESPEELARRSVANLQKVLDDIAEQKDPRAILTGLGLAVAMTLAWILVLRGIMALDRRVGGWAVRRVGERVKKVKVSGVAAFDTGHFIRFVRTAVRIASWIVGLIVTFIWINASLAVVPQTRSWGERLGGLLFGVVETIGSAVLDALPGLFFVGVIIFIARFIARAGEMFFDRVRDDGMTIGWLDRDTAPPTRMVFTLVVWLFAIAMAYPYLPGSNSQAFQGLSVLVGLMVSIGASSTVGQAASGLILMYTRAFRVGEFVRIQESEGTVIELGLFATRIRTGMGEEVMLPNTVVLANRSKNYSRVVEGKGFIIDAVVSIGYDAPWRQVHAMLVSAAGRVDTIALDPVPRVYQTALSDFYAEYRLVAYSRAKAPLPRAEAQSQLHGAIQDVFNEHGVQIMSPHYLGDPAEAKVVPKDRWYEAPATPAPPAK